MQTPQQPGELLSMSEQLPSFTSVESLKVESAPNNSQGVFAFFEKASLRTQQLFIASTAGLIASLVVVAVIQLSAKIIPPQGNTALSQLIEMGLAALVTAIAVGVTTFALGLITTDQINRAIDNLQTQFNTLAEGSLAVQATVYSPKELEQLAMSFNQMTQAINTMLSEAQRKADEQEKAREDLQHQLIQLLQHDVEETFGNDLNVQAEEITSEENEHPINPQGTLLNFIEELNGITRFRETLNPNLLLCSSTLEEIQQHKNDLEYRKLWLQALMEETQKELKFLALLIQNAEQNKS